MYLVPATVEGISVFSFFYLTLEILQFVSFKDVMNSFRIKERMSH
jgi:hypothetical protein